MTWNDPTHDATKDFLDARKSFIGGPPKGPTSLFVTKRVWKMVLAASEEERRKIASDIVAMAGAFGLSVPIKVYIYSDKESQPVAELHPNMEFKIL